MISKRLLLLCLLPMLLNGCALTFKKPPANNPSDDATIKLAEAAVTVSDSMLEMARVEKVLKPHFGRNNRIYIPTTRTLETRASVDWSGPIAELTARIAKAARFRFNVLGKAPAVPVLISINAKDASLAELLRNIDYQAGKKASIHVYPDRRVIELRYAKFYG
jgi:defect-in-organelle-trafficking protein DotD